MLITTTDWSRYADNEADLDPEEAKKQGAKHRTHGGGPMKVPSRPPWKDEFESPFLKQTPEDVAEALRSIQDDARQLLRDYCVILNSQTVEDRTALLVKTARSEADQLPPGHEEEPIVKVRETFQEVNGLITSASAGVSSLAKTLWNQQASKSK